MSLSWGCILHLEYLLKGPCATGLGPLPMTLFVSVDPLTGEGQVRSHVGKHIPESILELWSLLFLSASHCHDVSCFLAIMRWGRFLYHVLSPPHVPKSNRTNWPWSEISKTVSQNKPHLFLSLLSQHFSTVRPSWLTYLASGWNKIPINDF